MTYDELLDEYRKVLSENKELRSKLYDNRKKLTPREVTTIRDAYRSGFSQSELAEIYDVNPATISRTVRGIYHR
ncbi:hypothetical protein N806_29795 [Rhodococcus sp. P27]|nr:hypothetical protein N806_29795 [Rhodococcus sp. P27]